MIFIGEAAARPPHHRDVQFPQRFDDIAAKAALIGNRRFLAHPHALVDAVTEMLGKLAIDVPIDLRAGLIGVNDVIGSYRSGLRVDGGGYKQAASKAENCEDFMTAMEDLVTRMLRAIIVGPPQGRDAQSRAAAEGGIIRVKDQVVLAGVAYHAGAYAGDDNFIQFGGHTARRRLRDGARRGRRSAMRT